MKTRPPAAQTLRTKPLALRAMPSKSTDALRIERDGGDFGAGLIRQASLITRGEAIGHERWIDAEMLASVAEGVNSARSGIKSRFTHPGLSGDGLGKFMGRVKNAAVVGDQVLADLHFASTAHNTPDGDLAEYVMDLADEDPEALAISIVYWVDEGAEQRHRADHTDAEGEFSSPDDRNERNFPHARLSKLDAADVVDEPAANPGGLFHRGQEIPGEATALLEYALLGGRASPGAVLGIDAERARQFVRRTLAARPDLRAAVADLGRDTHETREAGGAAGTVPAHEENAMAENNKGSAPTPAAAAEPKSVPATISELKTAFPDAADGFLVACLSGGLDLAAAAKAHLESVKRDNQALGETVVRLRAELEAANKRALAAEARALQIGTDGRAVSGGGAAGFPDTEQGWKDEFASNPELQDEFKAADTYVAFRRSVKTGRARLV